jgi:hypothetical protein
MPGRRSRTGSEVPGLPQDCARFRQAPAQLMWDFPAAGRNLPGAWAARRDRQAREYASLSYSRSR